MTLDEAAGSPPNRRLVAVKSVTEMSVDERDDFYRQLQLLVLEEAPLWEVPLGSRDLLPSGEIVHGPWSIAECAQVLVGWLDEGLIGLYRIRVWGYDDETLTIDEARLILHDTSRWALEGGQSAWLFPTEAGQRAFG